MRGLYPSEFAETMSVREVDIIYSVLLEVHGLVEALLHPDTHFRHFIYESPDGTQETFRFTHSDLDTPAIALRALETHRGRSLPVFGFDTDLSRGRYLQTGETREITEADRFKIVDGPLATGNPGRFLTWIAKE